MLWNRNPTTNSVAAGRDVLEAPWLDIVTLSDVAGQRICLFVSHLPHTRFSPLTLHYMRSLRQIGLKVFALAAVDDISGTFDPPPADCADAFVIRGNEGYDFALWAAALRRHPQLLEADALMLANDSVLGPSTAFAALATTLNACNADFVGLTENLEVQKHLQSYFLYFKSSALRSAGFRDFWQDVKSLPTKFDVVHAYEIPLMARLEATGLRGKALYPATAAGNPTLLRWRELLDQGFPFIKTQLLRDNPRMADLTEWREIASKHGFDVRLIENHLRDRYPKSAVLQPFRA
jgi:hypothetical protein